MENPTHKVSFWGVRCYLREDDGCLWGINMFHEFLIPAAIWFHNVMSFLASMVNPEWEQPGFRFKILDTYEKGVVFRGDIFP
jgi:hypothetical protein